MPISRRLLAGLTLILAVGACENDEPGLTMEESVALLQGMGQEMQVMLSDTITPIHVSQDSIVVACPRGGRAALVVAEPSGDTNQLALDVQVTPTGCVVAGGGLQFTVDGNPNFVYVLTITATFSITGSITGGLSWELDGRSGDCDIALTLEAVPDLATQTLSGAYKGTLCGHEVEIDAAQLVPTDL